MSEPENNATNDQAVGAATLPNMADINAGTDGATKPVEQNTVSGQGNVVAMSPDNSPNNAASNQQNTEQLQPTVAAAEPQQVQEAPKKKSKMKGSLVKLLILVLVMGAGKFGMDHYKEQKKQERLAKYKQQQLKEQQVASIQQQANQLITTEQSTSSYKLDLPPASQQQPVYQISQSGSNQDLGSDASLAQLEQANVQSIGVESHVQHQTDVLTSNVDIGGDVADRSDNITISNGSLPGDVVTRQEFNAFKQILSKDFARVQKMADEAHNKMRDIVEPIVIDIMNKKGQLTAEDIRALRDAAVEARVAKRLAEKAMTDSAEVKAQYSTKIAQLEKTVAKLQVADNAIINKAAAEAKKDLPIPPFAFLMVEEFNRTHYATFQENDSNSMLVLAVGESRHGWKLKEAVNNVNGHVAVVVHEASGHEHTFKSGY